MFKSHNVNILNKNIHIALILSYYLISGIYNKNI